LESHNRIRGPSRTRAEAVDALEEAIQIMRLIWDIDGSSYRATFNGKFYRLDGAQTGPRPFHPIRIWLGAYGPKMLRLTGRILYNRNIYDGIIGDRRLCKRSRRDLDKNSFESKMRILKENAMTILDYVLTLKSEINLTDTIGLPSLWR
jgi:hypothetical protein